MAHVYVKRLPDGAGILVHGDQEGRPQTFDHATAAARHLLGDRHAPIIVLDSSGTISVEPAPSARPTRRMAAVRNPPAVSGRLLAHAARHVADWQRGAAKPPFLMTDQELMKTYVTKDRPRIHVAWNQAVEESGKHRAIKNNPRKPAAVALGKKIAQHVKEYRAGTSPGWYVMNDPELIARYGTDDRETIGALWDKATRDARWSGVMNSHAHNPVR